MPEDPLDLRREPVVGHAVGLVEDDDVDGRHRDLVRLEQVDQPQRRGDDDVDALAQLLDLIGPAGPAVHGEDALTGDGGDRFEDLGDLHRELPGGDEHEAQRVSRARVLDDAGHHRDAERERLAGTGAGPSAHVAAGHRDRDRGGLDHERLGEPGRRETDVDALRNAELGESGGRLDRRKRVETGEFGGRGRSRGVH